MKTCSLWTGGEEVAIAQWTGLRHHPAVQGSNPKHTIYTYIVKFCTLFVIVLRKLRK